jgi:hypothetical protein
MMIDTDDGRDQLEWLDRGEQGLHPGMAQLTAGLTSLLMVCRPWPIRAPRSLPVPTLALGVVSRVPVNSLARS